MFILFFFTINGFCFVKKIDNCTDLLSIDSGFNADIEITADIDCSGFVHNSPIAFSGFIEGNNHAISNLLIEGKGSYVGLFSTLEGASIKNLTIDNFNIILDSNSRTFYAGVLAGNILSSQLNNVIIVNTDISYSNAVYAPRGLQGVGLLSGNLHKSYITNLKLYGSKITTSYGVERIGGLSGVMSSTLLQSVSISGLLLDVRVGRSSNKAHIGGVIGYMLSDSNINNLLLDGLEINIAGADQVSSAGFLAGRLFSNTRISNVNISPNNKYLFDNFYRKIDRLAFVVGFAQKGSRLECVSFNADSMKNNLPLVYGDGYVDGCD